MSMIVPAGNKNVVWSPKDQNLTKTASTEVAQEEVNPLYEAAKKFAMDNVPCDKCNKPCSECTCEKSDVVEVAAPASSGSASSDVKSDAKSDKALPFETAPAASDEKAKEAIEKIEEGIVEIKEICDVKSDSNGVAEEVTLDVGESKPISDSVTIEVEDAPAIPGVENGGEILEKKSEPCAACGAVASTDKSVKTAWNFDKKDDKKSDEKSDKKSDKKSDEKDAKSSSDTKGSSDAKSEKTASTEEEFTKFAKLSPVNKKKVADYWVNMLIFPKDYVALMTKDYEK